MARPIRQDNIILIILIAVAAWLAMEGLKLDVQFGAGDFGPGGLPVLMFGSITLCCSMLLIRNLLILRADKSAPRDDSGKQDHGAGRLPRYLPFFIILLTTLYLVSIEYVGFVVVTPLFLLAAYLLVGSQHYRITRRKIAQGVVFALVAVTLLTLVFVSLLNVPLPIQPRFFQ
ncbi:tripartite tricarboxylate transporter TctB family protein [Stutzerimonas azotifigens]|uniref:tripartite tricarboxylate transporter TctB family protein n=1 Tax=Stutzerimonas azotifigens TaxID=291995 RepID=UPI0004838E56|nr:tripartite tricarboxylate transporter TctB family protein [Stutzerimonas azotifigens]